VASPPQTILQILHSQILRGCSVAPQIPRNEANVRRLMPSCPPGAIPVSLRHTKKRPGAAWEDSMANRLGIGQPVRRVEDVRFITGAGRYVDDMDLPKQLYGQIVLSEHAHARIKRVDTAAAKKAPGVVLVLTGADIKAAGIGNLPPLFMPEDVGGPKGYRANRAILAQDKLRHVGDRVAFVVAETQAQARDAADLIEIDVDILPAVTDLEAAVKPGAPQVWTRR